jgi:hypothetical protein
MVNLDIYNPQKVREIVEQLTAERNEAYDGIRAAHRILDEYGVKREDEIPQGGGVLVTEYPVWERIGFLKESLSTVKEPSRPKIVCVCGSSRFVDRIAVLKWEMEKQGIVAIGMHLLPGWYGAEPHHQAEKENVAHILDELHLQKIKMADEVLIANYDGYIGERTRIEIDYAQQLGKPIQYVQVPA